MLCALQPGRLSEGDHGPGDFGIRFRAWLSRRGTPARTSTCQMVLWSRPTFAPMRRMDQPDSHSAITVATSVSVRGCRRIVASCSRSNRSTVPCPG